MVHVALKNSLFACLLLFSYVGLSESDSSESESRCCDEPGPLSFAIDGEMRNFSAQGVLLGNISVKVVDPRGRNIALGSTTFGPINPRSTQDISFPDTLIKDSCNGEYLVVFQIDLANNSTFNFDYFGNIIVTNRCTNSTTAVPFDHYTNGDITLTSYQFQTGYYFSCERNTALPTIPYSPDLSSQHDFLFKSQQTTLPPSLPLLAPL